MAPTPDLASQRLLVIDDDETFSHAIGRWVAELGYDARTVRSLDDAIGVLQEQHFSAILLDLHLGDESGLSLLRRLNRSRRTVPVIMMSGDASPEDLIRLLRERAVDFLAKPFGFDELSAALDRAGTSNKSVPGPAPDSVSASPLTDTETHGLADPAAGGAEPEPQPEQEPSEASGVTGVETQTNEDAETGSKPAVEPKAKLRPIVALVANAIKNGKVSLPIIDPKIAELKQYLVRDDFCAEDIAALLLRDAALASGVVRLANSASFARGEPVTTPLDACVRLGAKQVVALAFELVVSNVIVGRGSRKQLLLGMWTNSIATSRVAARLATLLGRGDATMLQVAALLHNIGEPLTMNLLLQLGKEAREILKDPGSALKPVHEQVGALVAESWGLPQMFVDLIGAHHRPRRNTELPADRQLRLVVLTAWHIAIEAGFTYFDEHDLEGFADNLAELGIDEAQLRNLYEEIADWDF